MTRQPIVTDDLQEFVDEAVRRRMAGHTPEQMAAWFVDLMVSDFPEGFIPPEAARDMERDLVACLTPSGEHDDLD